MRNKQKIYNLNRELEKKVPDIEKKSWKQTIQTTFI